MRTIRSLAFYQHVPTEQRERLRAFRMTHPREQIDLKGATWSYLLGGRGSETLLILPGGERIGDVAFPLMQQFEPEYRCLYPSYPPLSTMRALIDGLATLLDRLSIVQVLLFAASFGGDVGQCFVRKYPERVSKLILLNTGIPDEQLGKATRGGKRLLSLLPLGIVRLLVQKLLVKALSVRPEERQIFQAMLRELVAHLTRADMVSTFDETIDYRLNYHFSSDDLATWPGKVLIVQSDDDPATTAARRLALRQLYPQAQTHTFERAGHTPFLSQPDEFYPLVRTFLHEP
ncbi:MAG TPA: alpha/beta hydrolase [Ktedonobacteraceae bacterium]